MIKGTTGNKVIVSPIMGSEISTGGIIVADNIRQRSAKSVVVAVGRKVDWLPVGAVVHHVPSAGEFLNEGEGYYSMLDIDIRAYYVN